MDDHVDNPFAEDRWRHDLATVLEEHELDQLSGVDADMLADYLADMAGRLVGLVKTRDRGMPGALNAVERSELAALRKVNKLQTALLAQKEAALVEQAEAVVNLNILLRDAYAQRDRALGAAKEEKA